MVGTLYVYLRPHKCVVGPITVYQRRNLVGDKCGTPRRLESVCLERWNGNVINPGGIYVKEVSVYDYNGRLLNMAKVEGCDNIVIPANAGDGVAIIIVSTTDRQFTYKVQTL